MGGFPGVGRLKGIQQGLESLPGLVTGVSPPLCPRGKGGSRCKPQRESAGGEGRAAGRRGAGPLLKEPGHGHCHLPLRGEEVEDREPTSFSFLVPVSHRASPGQTQPESEGRQATDTGQGSQPEGTEPVGRGGQGSGRASGSSELLV